MHNYAASACRTSALAPLPLLVAGRCQQPALMLADKLGSDVLVHEHSRLLPDSEAGRVSRPASDRLARVGMRGRGQLTLLARTPAGGK